MEQERFMVIDNEKGVVIPLQSEKRISIERENGTKDVKNTGLEEKVNRVYQLMKALVKQSIRDTIREYNMQLTTELKEFEGKEIKRWEKLEAADLKRWEKLEKTDMNRWKDMKEEDSKRWNELKKDSEQHWSALHKMEEEHLEKMRREEERKWEHMEEHFRELDKAIRQKQDGNKRKKHSIF